jgi:hypothetical protein
MNLVKIEFSFKSRQAHKDQTQNIAENKMQFDFFYVT